MIKEQAYDNIGHINSFKDEVNETSICSMETELIYSTNHILIALKVYFNHYVFEEPLIESISINELEALSWEELKERLQNTLARAEKKTEEIYN